MSLNSQISSLPKGRDQAFFVNGPCGRLECLAHCPPNAQCALTAIICHPHPLYQGSMRNKVVHTLSRAYERLGVKSIRFNFRGVGNSDGEYGHSQGEIEDLLAIINWARKCLPNDAIALAGFSFGSYIASACAMAAKSHHLVSIAPPVHHFPFSELTNINCPWLIVQGTADEIVNPQQVYQWSEQLPTTARLVTIDSADHFFHGNIIELRGQLEQNINHWL